MTVPTEAVEDMPTSEKIAPGCLAAACAAGLVPALPLFLGGQFALALIYFLAATFVAAVFALVFGLPLYHLLSRKGRPGAATAMICGLAIGAVPSLVLALLIEAWSGPVSAGSGWWEWLQQRAALLGMPLFFGGCGLVAGLAFWAVALRGPED